MIVSKPTLQVKDDKTFVISSILDEKTNTSKDMFFAVSNEYAPYLVTEHADAFVVALILPALLSKQDIIIKGTISNSLLYHSKTLIFLLSKAFNCPVINIKADLVEHFNFQPYAVATGFSGGIDSFATFIKQTSEQCPQEFRINHFALFNVGAYGNTYTKTRKEFLNDAERASEFAKSVNMPLILIDSNISEWCNEGILIYFATRITLAITAGIYILQKLFKTYYISSGDTIDELGLHPWDQCHYDSAMTQLLSNNNVSIYMTEKTITRLEKTRIVTQLEASKKFLYVCAAASHNEKHGYNFQKGNFKHCGECVKCTRTLLTLDFLGVLHEYRQLFDLKKYNASRDSLILDIYETKASNHFKEEIYQLMISSGYQLPRHLERTLRKRKLIQAAKKMIHRLKAFKWLLSAQLKKSRS